MARSIFFALIVAAIALAHGTHAEAVKAWEGTLELNPTLGSTIRIQSTTPTKAPSTTPTRARTIC